MNGLDTIDVTIRTPDDDTKTGTGEFVYHWELLGKEVQRSVYESPICLAMPSDVVKVLRQAPRFVLDGRITRTQAIDDITAIVNAQSVTEKTLLRNDALAMFDHDFRLEGQASFIDSETVLRLTQTIGIEVYQPVVGHEYSASFIRQPSCSPRHRTTKLP